MPRPAKQADAFPCEQCGALQTFSPGAGKLRCPYCEHENPVPESLEVIRELDFRRALRELGKAKPTDVATGTKCESCAAEFSFDEHVHSDLCPYCGTPIVRHPGDYRHFRPRSLLPFKVGEREAQDSFHTWLRGLWFAPGAMVRHAREEDPLVGVYVPFWTYDSQTDSDYRGERGTAYYERESYTETVDGRRVRRSRVVRRIRWSPVSGRVSRFFDDVLVGASRSLPRKITERLAPWDLDELVPYAEHYLSGFRSELYQVDLDESFEHARSIMDAVIRNDVMGDIGGDAQRIHSVHTRHSDTSFKHLLLPVWSAAFVYRGKSYRFVVNGRTGRVQGERPYSYLKIGLAALCVVAGLAALAVLLGGAG